MGSQWVGSLMYCYFINCSPSYTPHQVTPTSQFLSCGLIVTMFQSYIKIKSVSQSLVCVLGQPLFGPPFIRGKYCIKFACWSQPQFSSNFKKNLQASSIYLNDHCPKRASNSDKNNVKKAILIYIKYQQYVRYVLFILFTK